MAAPPVKKQDPEIGIRLLMTPTGVSVYRSDKITEASFADFAKHFLSDPAATGWSTPILPKGTRLYHESAENINVMIEVEPGTKPIQTNKLSRPVRVAMPWQYFILRFVRVAENKLGVTFRMEPTWIWWSRNRQNPAYPDKMFINVFPARVPNVDRNGVICYGNTMPDSRLPLFQRAEEVVSGFFATESVFNKDMGWNLPSPYGTFTDWARATRDNPLCFLSWDEWGATRSFDLREYFPPSRSGQNLTMESVIKQMRQSFGSTW